MQQHGVAVAAALHPPVCKFDLARDRVTLTAPWGLCLDGAARTGRSLALFEEDRPVLVVYPAEVGLQARGFPRVSNMAEQSLSLLAGRVGETLGDDGVGQR